MSDYERHFKLKTHLKVIGTILESSQFYSNRRKELFENLVVQTIQLIHQKGEFPTIGSIQKVLQYEKTPLINRVKLIGILKSLEESEIITSSKKDGKEVFECLSKNPIPKNPIRKSLRESYRRFVFSNSDRYFDLFQEVLVEAFSELGINTVNQLFIKKLNYNSSIEEIISDKQNQIEEDDYLDFKEGVLAFFESDSEAAKEIKISLAQAYTALRMMGAGNWQAGELDKVLKNKTLIIDSNVIFSFVSAQSGNHNPVLEALKTLKLDKSVNFLIAHETKEEFFRAVTHQLKELKKAYQQNLNVNILHENGMFDIDWFNLFKEFTKDKCPLEETENFYGYLERLVEDIIDELNCAEVYIDSINIEVNSSPKEELLKELISKKCRKPKSNKALKHDSLMWDYLEENQSFRLFSHDSIWRHVKINKSNKAINAGNLFLYITIGSMKTKKFSHLLNHVIKNNLLSENNLFTLEEICSLGNAEEKVLSLPRAKRRELITKIHDLRKQKFEMGKPFVSEEISALAFSYLVSVDDSTIENNQIKYLETQLKDQLEILQKTKNINSSLETALGKTTIEAKNFKSDKLHLALSILGLVLTSIAMHFIHSYYKVPWIQLSMPIFIIFLYISIGYFKGFKKGWTITTTVASLLFSGIALSLRINTPDLEVATKKSDSVSEQMSGTER